jgi:IS5 family transposase
MEILPQFLKVIVTENAGALQSWFSKVLFERLTKHARRHLLVRLKDELDMSPIEKACKGYYHESGPGTTSKYRIEQLVRVLLVKYLYNWSLRDTEERLRHDLVVKWFVGCGVFDEVMDHSTLERFEQWVNKQQHRLFFDEVLKQIDADFPEEGSGVQIGDTFAMKANAASEGVMTLLRHTSRCLLTEIKRGAGQEYERILKSLDQISLFGTGEESWEYLQVETNRAERRLKTVQGVWQLQQLVKPQLAGWQEPLRSRVSLRLEDLDKVIADELQVTLDGEGKPTQVSLLPQKDKGHYRLCSATDPEATCRSHGHNHTVGYNIGLAVTPQAFIREIQAASGAEPDQAGVARLISEQLEHQGTCPSKFLYDQAAGAGCTRAEVAKVSAGQTQLVAQIPPSSTNARFAPDAFHFTPAGALECPNHKTTVQAHPASDSDGMIYSFSAKTCQGCSLWQQCRDAKAAPKGSRRVFISDYLEEVRQAKEYNRLPIFQQEMKQRPLVERVIFMLTHYDGARYARSRGKQRADFQAKMCATARNLRTWLNRLDRKKTEQGINVA